MKNSSYRMILFIVLISINGKYNWKMGNSNLFISSTVLEGRVRRVLRRVFGKKVKVVEKN